MKIYIYILKLHIKYDIIYSDNYILVYSISYICYSTIVSINTIIINYIAIYMKAYKCITNICCNITYNLCFTLI